MISRPPPPRGYKYNPVNGKLEKKPPSIRTVGRGHRRRHRRKRRKGGNIAGKARQALKMLEFVQRLKNQPKKAIKQMILRRMLK